MIDDSVARGAVCGSLFGGEANVLWLDSGGVGCGAESTVRFADGQVPMKRASRRVYEAHFQHQETNPMPALGVGGGWWWWVGKVRGATVEAGAMEP